jgi:AcrR family transcriptional regulator
LNTTAGYLAPDDYGAAVEDPVLTRAAGHSGWPGEAPLARPAKSAQTRTLIVETALRLFAERGYDRTTMRVIAAEAGVSVGNAYYYFPSKEHLIQGFYDRIQELHHAASAQVLATERRLGPRLRGVLLAWLEVAAPYHEFGTQIFKNAADPSSPLSPFSPESGPARDAYIALFREVVDGSKVKIHPELRAQLPQLLWLCQMGIVLFWVHDRSTGCARSHRLVEQTVPLIEQFIAFSRLRVLWPMTHEIVELLTSFYVPEEDGPGDVPLGIGPGAGPRPR